MENRVIKFRAWNKKEKRIISWDWFLNNKVAEMFYNEDFVLMQYTGLKDCNGKEIYEGDIVEQVNNIGWSTRIGYIRKKSRGVVKFVNGMFTAGLAIDLKKSKVIGNVYENPELLQGSKE